MDVGSYIQQAIALAQGGRMAEAIAKLEAAIREHPDSAQARGLLGTLLHSTGRTADAITHLQRAAELAPGVAPVAFQLGALLISAGEPLRGLPHMQRAVDLDGKWLPGLLGFARALQGVGDFDRSEVNYRKALAVDPRNAEAACGLAGMLMAAGRQKDAVELFRTAGRDHPGDINVQGKLLSALNYADDAPAEEVFDAHVRWGKLAMVGGEPDWRFSNPRDPNKRIRVGLLSTDLWEHSVAYFLRPLLTHRDRLKLELVCYSTATKSDWMTAELRAAADGWRDVSACNERTLVDAIRADTLDVLIELSGHTANGPLPALKRRAAPVQATYLGYPNTTGLPTIDWRIVDDVTDPAGAERHHTERLMRIDGCFICYGGPAQDFGEWAVSPATTPRTDRPITFGSFNSIRKLGPEVIKTWASVLHTVPGSKLFIKTRGIGTPAARRNFTTAFAFHGISADRLELQDAVNDKWEHLSAYHRIDVALDTFPYNGTTTTCEALWMGAPVIALQGRTHPGRVGASILHAAGLPELIAASSEQFIQIAAELAKDRPRLETLRNGLAQKVRTSALCNGPGMATRFEGAIRMMWHDWCGRA